LSRDPYEILGLKKDASAAEIRKAYRRLAKSKHPDLNPGNKRAENEFKELSAAYDLLNDPEKRASYDRGEIDASGNPGPRQRYYSDFAQSGEPNPYGGESAFADFADEGLFSIFGMGRGAGARMRGADVRYRLPVDFLDAVNGATRQVRLSDGSTLDVAIPPGVEDGQVLRLRGKGEPGRGGGPQGDVLIEVEVRPHPLFRREGDDIRLDQPLPLKTAVLGGSAVVPTPTGPVTMKVPRWTNGGKVMRLKGKGVRRPDGKRGHQYVTFRIMLPAEPDPALDDFVRGWEPSTQTHETSRGR
jgi:DnaJ-class molecular chaperone